MMCDHCLSPDTSSGAGIGCDNMTVLIIAILHGRTKEEWYSWVTDRVNRNYGYETPATLPQIYAQSRILSYRARKEAREAREREREAIDRERELERAKQENKVEEVSPAGSGLSGFTKILSTTGGISFTLGSPGITSDSGARMFGNDDSDDDEDSNDEETSTRPLPSDTPGAEPPKSPDPTKHLKAKLDELEREIREEGDKGDDGDSQMADTGDSDSAREIEFPNTSQPHRQGEAPAPPKPLPNGDASAPVEQLQAHPHGDEPLPVLKAEGLIDSSEDPLVKV